MDVRHTYRSSISNRTWKEPRRPMSNRQAQIYPLIGHSLAMLTTTMDLPAVSMVTGRSSRPGATGIATIWNRVQITNQLRGTKESRLGSRRRRTRCLVGGTHRGREIHDRHSGYRDKSFSCFTRIIQKLQPCCSQLNQH
jgi:hypothetical protein